MEKIWTRGSADRKLNIAIYRRYIQAKTFRTGSEESYCDCITKEEVEIL